MTLPSPFGGTDAVPTYLLALAAVSLPLTAAAALATTPPDQLLLPTEGACRGGQGDMTRIAWLGTALLIATVGTGCVERRYVVTSDPPGALVFRNGVPLGPTPVDDFYVYYGEYDITLVKD